MPLQTGTSLELLKDPKFYLENFTKIKAKSGQIIPFVLNEAQKELFNSVRSHNRVIILKARQIGFSSAMVGLFYHYTIMNPGTTTALVGYNSELTAELLDKVKTFYRTTPDEVKPSIHYNSRFEISFPRLESKILVLPSTENVGRGYTINNCLASELAFWEKADEKMMTLEASVPITGKLVVESTPNGVGNAYHRMWMGENDYDKKEFGWWWLYTKEEIETIRRRMNNPRKFSQEYELEFLSAGRSVFDAAVVKEQRNNVLQAGMEYELEDGTKKKVYEEDKWTIYREPELKGIYVMGVDVSEGVEGGDYSVATIFNRVSGEEVARYRALIAPDMLATKIDKMGRRYNNALMVVEINNHGLTTITVLKNLLYPTLYFRPAKFDALSGLTSNKLGWKTTKVTRPLLIDDFAQACRDSILTLHSKELVDEMSVFVYDDKGNMGPQSGWHDDSIFSAGIAFQGFSVMHTGDMSQPSYEDHLPINFAY